MARALRPVIAGNWKMHGTLASARALAAAVRAGVEAAEAAAEVVVCPPHPHLAAVAEVLAGGPVALGAQDCHALPAGAHTGDVSAAMLADCGCRFTIVGHSERRAEHHETDGVVRGKALAALEAGLTPILCVGESAAERAAGRAEEVVVVQLAGSLPEAFCAAGGIIAYEPVWAIGSGRTPTGPEIAAMHAAIRRALAARFGEAGAATRILYGGSVKPENAGAILSLPEVNGALVGGASLSAEAFLAILRAAGQRGRHG
jgi:triosephosphate isomerase